MNRRDSESETQSKVNRLGAPQQAAGAQSDFDGDDPFERRPIRRKKRRRILGPWARLTLLAAGCIVIVMALVALVGKIARPHQEVTALQAQLDTSRAQLAHQNAENADYSRRIAYVNTPEGVATEARQYGYVKPHEVPVVVADSKPIWSPPAPLVQTPSPAPTFGQRVERFLDGIWRRR